MSVTTTETVTITDPEGGERSVTLRFEWGEFERNPFDKEPSRYRGEDDGRVIESVELE